jgi:hypothetical protein
MAWVDKSTIDYLHLWYQEWYSKRYANDLIKPDFLTGLVAARAAVKEFSDREPLNISQETSTDDHNPQQSQPETVASKYPCGPHMIHCTHHNCDECISNPINQYPQ